jgi:hypothetical protein
VIERGGSGCYTAPISRGSDDEHDASNPDEVTKSDNEGDNALANGRRRKAAVKKRKKEMSLKHRMREVPKNVMKRKKLTHPGVVMLGQREWSELDHWDRTKMLDSEIDANIGHYNKKQCTSRT